MKDFIVQEIDRLSVEVANAQAFILKAEGAIMTHRSILEKIDANDDSPGSRDEIRE